MPWFYFYVRIVLQGVIVIRAFIGIDFDNNLKKDISGLQQRIRKYAVSGRWSRIDNFHLTLKFLDEINLRQKEQIDEVMKKICFSRNPFNLALSGLGIFNGRDSIRVLWLGITGDIPELQSFQKSIDGAMDIIGFLTEKRSYSPHITIGQDIALSCSFDELKDMLGKVEFNPFQVNNTILFKSEQVQNKRIYTNVVEYGFGGRLCGDKAESYMDCL